jgi:subfamily B ATP-binding cassette protein MsbA
MNLDRRLFNSYIRPNLGTLIGGLICAGGVSLIVVSVGWFIKQAIDAMANGREHWLNVMCVGIIGIFLVKGCFAFGQSYLLALTANRIGARLRDEIYGHLNTLSLAYFNRRRTGAVMSVLTNDVPVVQNAMIGLKEAVTAPITIVISLGGLFVTNWRLAVVSLVFIPAMAGVISRIGKRIRSIAGQVQRKLSDMTTILEETIAGVRIIKSFAAEEHEVKRFELENDRTLKTIMRAARRTAQLRPIVDFIGALGIALLLFIGGHAVAFTTHEQQREQLEWIRSVKRPDQAPRPPASFPVPPGGMTAGSLIAFLYLLDQVARCAGELGGMAALRAQALAAAKRIFDEVLDVETEVKELPDAIRLPQLAGHVRFVNVCFRYAPDDPDVLHDVCLEVRPGEAIALVGRTGCGKSTVVDLLSRFYDPTSGRIEVDGHDLRDVSLYSLRKQIGIVPQETWLFAGSLRDNIAYGKRDATDEQIRAAAYAANAYFVDAMRDRFDTIVGDRGIRLSGGERQRIAIARAILMDPRILILDEATSALDASSEALVQEALDELMKGRTTIMIAHRLSTIINADRILAMQDGRIVEVGSHQELMAAGGYYAQLYETQLRGFE